MGNNSGNTLLTTSPALKLWDVTMTECGVHKKYNSETFPYGGSKRKVVKTQMCNVTFEPHSFTTVLVLNMQHVDFGELLFCFVLTETGSPCIDQASVQLTEIHRLCSLRMGLKAWATTSGLDLRPPRVINAAFLLYIQRFLLLKVS